MAPVIQKQVAKETGAKTQNTEFLAADIVPSIENLNSSTYSVIIAVSVTAAVLEITFDSGTTWLKLNAGTPIPIGQLFAFELPGVDSTDTINFRASNASGTTLDYFRVISERF